MQLHFKSFGSGKPVIILHGLFGMLDNWQSFAKDLSDRYLIYLFDLRNHGKSAHDQLMTYPVMAEDLKETMENHWMYDGAIILGHSMGGKVAMQLALSHPELVKALIVVDIAPVVYPGGHEAIIQALDEVPLDTVTSRQEVNHYLSRSIKDPTVVNFLMKNLSRNHAGRYGWKMNLDVIATHYQQLLNEPRFIMAFEGPTLFIRGARSNYILPEHDQRIAEWFPNSSIQTIDNAGHWIHADEPQRLRQIVEAFIEGLAT